MLLVEGEERKSFRLGRRRFQVPYSGYTPPAYFFIPLERGEKVAGRVSRKLKVHMVKLLQQKKNFLQDFLWKFCVQLREGSGKLDIPSQHLLPRVTLSRGFALPQVLGLGLTLALPHINETKCKLLFLLLVPTRRECKVALARYTYIVGPGFEIRLVQQLFKIRKKHF